MKLLLALLAVLALVAVALAALKNKGNASASPIKAKTPLTKNEQPMYFRLCETFPEHIVLAQVAFSALLSTKLQTTRNKYDRKVADFVLCSRSFAVIAVIELDDSSHATKGAADKARDALLTGAGYRVIRFARVPDAETLRKAVEPPTAPNPV